MFPIHDLMRKWNKIVHIELAIQLCPHLSFISLLILYWKKLKIGILIMRVKITKSYTVILENWYLQLLIQYLLKEKVIDKCFCGFGWCPLLVTWCDHIHHSPTRSPASSSSQDPPKEMEEEEKTHNLPYITRRVSSRDCQLLAWRFRLPFRSIFCASVSVWVLR